MPPMADLGMGCHASGGDGREPKARGSRFQKRRGGGVWGRGFPLPTWKGFREGAVPPPQNFFLTFEWKWCVLVHFAWVLFLQTNLTNCPS